MNSMRCRRGIRTRLTARLALPDGGFTAVELMVSITVMAIMMLGFLTIFPLGMRTVQKGENLSVATNLVQNQIERLKAFDYDDPDLATGVHADPGNPVQGVYTRTWTVQADAPMQGMKTVEVLVTYNDGGAPRNLQMSTYITQK